MKCTRLRFPGKIWYHRIWWKIFVLKIGGPELMVVQWMNCLEANTQRILKHQAENRKYSRRWHHMDFGRRGGDGYLLLLYFSR